MESTFNLNVFKKKMIVLANVFPQLKTVKNLVRPLFKKRRFRTSFDSQHVKGSQKLVKSSWEHFYQIFTSLCWEMIRKISPLFKFENIRVFLNTWTADYKYSVPDCENLQFPIQMQLSSKPKTFSELFLPLMESKSNFKHFQKKDDRHS